VQFGILHQVNHRPWIVRKTREKQPFSITSQSGESAEVLSAGTHDAGEGEKEVGKLVQTRTKGDGLKRKRA